MDNLENLVRTQPSFFGHLKEKCNAVSYYLNQPVDIKGAALCVGEKLGVAAVGATVLALSPLLLAGAYVLDSLHKQYAQAHDVPQLKSQINALGTSASPELLGRYTAAKDAAYMDVATMLRKASYNI